jgi:hypothetical protein
VRVSDSECGGLAGAENLEEITIMKGREEKYIVRRARIISLSYVSLSGDRRRHRKPDDFLSSGCCMENRKLFAIPCSLDDRPKKQN